jgi:hypothetical protein
MQLEHLSITTVDDRRRENRMNESDHAVSVTMTGLQLQCTCTGSKLMSCQYLDKTRTLANTRSDEDLFSNRVLMCRRDDALFE